MSISRKQFCERMLSSSVVLLFTACGGGGSGYSSSPSPSPAPTPTAAGTCGAGDAAITGNHGHALTVPRTDLDSTVDITYNIQAQADHNHTVTLSAAQLAQLKAGQMVTVTSSTTFSHNHAVTVSCS